MTYARYPPSFRLLLSEQWNENTGQKGDDCNQDEQLDEGEGGPGLFLLRRNLGWRWEFHAVLLREDEVVGGDLLVADHGLEPGGVGLLKAAVTHDEVSPFVVDGFGP